MEHPRGRARLAALLVIAASLVAFARYGFALVSTIAYPHQLEWMEGEMLDVVARVLAREPIYVAPSVEHVPHVYPPLWFYAVAGVAKLSGLELLPARVVSFAATLGIVAMLFAATRREARSAVLGLSSAALFVAAYELTGRWLHLARLDTLFVLLLLGGALVLRDGRGRFAGPIAGALLALAFFTKQPALFAAVPLLAGAWVDDMRRATAAAATLGVFVVVGIVAGSVATDGWLIYYTFDLPAQHALAVGPSLAYLARTWWPVAPATLAAGAVVMHGLRSGAARRGTDAGLLAGFAVASLAAFAHTGAERNALLPLAVAIALHAPRLISVLRGGAVLGARAVLAAQILVLALATGGGPGAPPPAAARNGDAFLSWVGEREGEVLVPDYGFLPTRVGKHSFGLGMGARDVLRADRGDRGRTLLEASLAEALGQRRFSTIVLSQQDWLGGAVAVTYEPRGTIELAPWPIAGHRTRPRYVWVRREAVP